MQKITICYGYKCQACSAPIIYMECTEGMKHVEPYAGYQYAMYCSNKVCQNHVGKPYTGKPVDFVVAATPDFGLKFARCDPMPPYWGAMTPPAISKLLINKDTGRSHFVYQQNPDQLQYPGDTERPQPQRLPEKPKARTITGSSPFRSNPSQPTHHDKESSMTKRYSTVFLTFRPGCTKEDFEKVFNNSRLREAVLKNEAFIEYKHTFDVKNPEASLAINTDMVAAKIARIDIRENEVVGTFVPFGSKGDFLRKELSEGSIPVFAMRSVLVDGVMSDIVTFDIRELVWIIAQ